jgi:pimeloyl-ACP methyl ester carboxylesterase
MDRDAPTALKEFTAGTGERNLSCEDLAAITLPVVVLSGELSLPYLRACTEEAASLIPGAKLRVVEGACHAVHLDRPEALVEALS